jgi:hypothetical protein
MNPRCRSSQPVANGSHTGAFISVDYPSGTDRRRHSIRLAVQGTHGVFIMKTRALTFAVAALAMLPSIAVAQRHRPALVSSGSAQPVEAAAMRWTSSNPWESLPAMSADRCLAEAIGTASDPRTGVPIRSSLDPQTGRPLCPSAQQTASTD